MTAQKTSPLEVATCNNIAKIWSRAWRKFDIYSAIAELRTKNASLNIGSLLHAVSQRFRGFQKLEVGTVKSEL